MVHSFYIEIAKEYGMLEAVLLQNIFFWVEKNKEDGRNFHDGKYWTYNSTKALQEYFPYVSERQIKYALKNLRDSGILETGNYNKHAMDRTLWYTLTEKGYALFKEDTDSTKLSHGQDKPVPSTVQNCPMDKTDLSNAADNFVQAIPDNKPDKNTDDKPVAYPGAGIQRQPMHSDKTTMQGYRNRERKKSPNKFLNFEQHYYTADDMALIERAMLAGSGKCVLRC